MSCKYENVLVKAIKGGYRAFCPKCGWSHDIYFAAPGMPVDGFVGWLNKCELEHKSIGIYQRYRSLI